MIGSGYFISCDWGTSNFRLAVVDTESLEILFQVKTDIGILKMYEEFKNSHTSDQQSFFSKYLLDQVKSLPKEHQFHTIVVSGMASANIGLKEMTYAEMPIAMDGHQLNHQVVDLSKERKALLISGARSRHGVMRGEEVQATGLSEKLAKNEEGVLILPGTHSKHILFDNGMFTDLRTYMTGELFDLLSRKSILANGIEKASWNKAETSSFEEGLEKGLKSETFASLFSLRVNFLLGQSSPKENYFYLSGLLIGEELRHLGKHSGKVYLASSEPMRHMYQIATEKMVNAESLVIFDEEELKKATFKGQIKVLKQYEK
jgi:2-dehydro-3-deoxygalactonokinase